MRYESKWDYLEHYGVKGQKHGQRRYQNEDGSLTAEGRDHYGVGDPRKAGGAASSGEQKKAAFKMLFNKKNNRPVTAGGAGQKKTGTSESDSDPNANKETPKQQKFRKAMEKVLKIGAGVAVASALAYAASKHVKNKANALLDKEHSKDLRRIMDLHDTLRKTIDSGGYDIKTTNDLYDRQRESTNAKLEGQNKYRDYQRNKINKSTREALKYIRGHR